LWEQVGAQATRIAGGDWTRHRQRCASNRQINAEIEPRNSGYPTWIRKKPEPTLDVSATMAYICRDSRRVLKPSYLRKGFVMLRRREFLSIAAAGGAATVVAGAPAVAETYGRGDLHTKKFGCVGDGTTDDTANFQAALNAAMSSGNRLFIDPGTYLISAPLSISSGLTMLGAWVNLSIIMLATGTMDGIIITALGPVKLENFRVRGVPGATAGYLINVSPSSVDAAYETFRDLSLENGFIALTMGNAILWTLDRCVIDSPSAGGVFVQSVSLPDAGDSSITNCIFRLGSTGSCIWQTSSGGLRIQNNKLLGGQHGYVLALNAGVQTSNLIIAGNSFEQQVVDSITAINASGPNFYNIIIAGNQFAVTPFPLNFNDPTPGYLNNLSISGNVFRGNGASGAVAITLGGESMFIVSGNVLGGAGSIGILIGPNSSSGKVSGNTIAGWATAIINQSGSVIVFN
jgi:hypothetical protein